MTYKQIEASREVRLWITQIAVPITTTVIAAGIAVPEVRQAVVDKCKKVGNSITKRMKRKEKKEIKEIYTVKNVTTFVNPITGEYRQFTRLEKD